VKLTTAIFDCLHLLQHPGGNCDSSSPGANSRCDHLLSQIQVTPANSIVNHQQPATQTLYDRVARVAHAALRNLCDQRSITIEQCFERGFIPDE
jgi:hypothetical protein